ncbi:MAG: DNA translocase FtsK [Eubacteriales bacterium]|nr:DNA translocase FtsK [Eubacteriales bacterium]
MARSVTGILLIAIGLISLLSIVGNIQGAVFTMIKQAMQGLGGGFCLGIPIFLIWGGVLVAFSAHKKAPVRAILLLSLLYLCILGIVNLLSKIGTSTLMERVVQYNNELTLPAADPDGYWPIITAGYHLCGTSGALGGAMGMLLAWPLWTFIGEIGGAVVLGIIGLVCLLFVSRFDIIGTIRQRRETSDQRMEERELNRQRRAYEKKLKKQEEQPPQPVQEEEGLLRPAYQRKKEAETAQPSGRFPAADAQAVTAPYPPVFPNAPAWPQNVPMPQQVMFVPPAATPAQLNTPPLYDEMIVPEAPESGDAPAWKLKTRLGKKSGDAEKSASPEAAVPQSQDRDSRKVLEKMEANRRRKQEIESRIAETVSETTTPETPKRQQREERTNVREAAAEPQMTAEQMAYARQTAAYRPPVRAQEERQPAASEKTADPFAAYKKPADLPQRGMSGQRLDKPELKLPKQKAEPAETKPKSTAGKEYPYPMIELLNLQTESLPDTREMDRVNAKRLEETLESFNIPARVQRVTHGPAVTRFELGLVSSGINVKRIMNIADNIALDMAANGGVRIEVPIPGTNLFGVEVPNNEIIGVSLAEVLTSPEMTKAKSPLSVALGKDISGRPVICDLAKMPHLLIAGQTGSGKSVCINSIVNSLLYRSTPEEVRMIMIDPKVVELQGYNQVPHLLIPVVSDPQKASGALAWAVQEMLDRYHKMQSKGVREIASYNAKTFGDEPKLPRIVIIIDELSDLMIACKKEVEESIIRLAQLARAAGIHMVVATQRPTVNVITGLIKANIPSRIAFAVSSSIDSRTILDMNGAEKLLGRGDMFYYPTGAKAPLRVQGCYVSDTEISNVVDYIGRNSETDYDESINEVMENQLAQEDDADTENGDGGDNDERLQEAVEMVLTDGQASISMLQRRMKIGYARAGRLIDDMASRGIVSRSAGSKPREVLITYEQYLRQKETLLR